MDYIEYLSAKNSKWSELKLQNVIYKPKDNVEIQLLFPDKFGVVSDDERAQIQSATEEYLDKKFNVNIKYKKSYVDSDVVWHYLSEFFKTNLKFADNLIVKDNVTVKSTTRDNIDNCQHREYEDFNISLSMSRSLYETMCSGDIIRALIDYLHSKLCANFSLTLDPSLQDDDLQSVLKTNDNHQTELSYLRDVSIKDEDKYYSFELGEAVFGQIPENMAIRLDQLKMASDKNIIAGSIKSITERKYPDKRDETKEKTMFTLTLEDHWSNMRCVHFPNQNTIECMQKLKEGDKIAILGDYEEFNGNFSFKIQGVAYADIGDKPQDNIEWRQPFNEYLVVQPQEYVEISQMTLLGAAPQEISPYLLERDVVVFDFETTGLSADNCYIIELGAVKIHNGQITETFSSFVKPPVHIPEEVTNLTHITDEMVADAPCYELVLADFYKFTRGCVMSAYNIEFDWKFLDKYSKSILFNFDNDKVDTMVLARQKIKGLPNYKLKTVVTHLGISLENAHRALDDTIATAKAFQKLI